MKRRLIIASVVMLLAAAAPPFLWPKADAGLRSKPRREWKDNAIADIAEQSMDSEWLESEIAALESNEAEMVFTHENWVSPNLLLMANGEWLVYRQVCQKEDMRIPDLFIAHGSDGKWYYSTYHFCIRMFMLIMEPTQPEDLSDFATTYSLVEFDGKSDECLRKTWPPEGG